MENWSMRLPAPSSPVDPNSALADSFFLQPCLDVARALLGKGLWHQTRSGLLLAEIVEVEAYLGTEDPASHAYRGPTARSRIMFERGGACYVYLSYGMNFCMNVVSGPEGRGEAVLLRAARPVEGIDQMFVNRGLPRDVSARKLMSGPGKLAKAMGVDLSFYGRRFDESDFRLVDLGVRYDDGQVLSSPRIGISKAAELPYRFTVRDSPWLSRKT